MAGLRNSGIDTSDWYLPGHAGTELLIGGGGQRYSPDDLFNLVAPAAPGNVLEFAPANRVFDPFPSFRHYNEGRISTLGWPLANSLQPDTSPLEGTLSQTPAGLTNHVFQLFWETDLPGDVFDSVQFSLVFDHPGTTWTTATFDLNGTSFALPLTFIGGAAPSLGTDVYTCQANSFLGDPDYLAALVPLATGGLQGGGIWSVTLS